MWDNFWAYDPLPVQRPIETAPRTGEVLVTSPMYVEPVEAIYNADIDLWEQNGEPLKSQPWYWIDIIA